jgi:hypothetical protein
VGFLGPVISVYIHWKLQPSMVVHACNPALGRLRQEDCEFEASLGYIAKMSPKKRKKEKENPKQNKNQGNFQSVSCSCFLL